MTVNVLNGIKTHKLFIPVLSIIFSVLALGYLLFSGLLPLVPFILGAMVLGSGFDYTFLFILITFLSFMVVIMLPLKLKRAVYFACLLLLTISLIQLLVSTGFRLPLTNTVVVPHPQIFDVLIVGVSFGLIIGICAKIYLYWLTLEGNVFYISRQTIIVSVFAEIIIGIVTSKQLPTVQLLGSVPIHGIIVGFIAVVALLLNNRTPSSEPN